MCRCGAAGLGMSPTTSSRRLFSMLTLSLGFVDQIWRQCLVGNSVNRIRSSGRPRAFRPLSGAIFAASW